MNCSFDYGALKEILDSMVVPIQDTVFLFCLAKLRYFLNYYRQI